MSDGHHIKLSDGPRWDYTVDVVDTDGRVVRVALISPNDLPDLPPGPLPTQAELDAQAKRNPGVFVRLKRWLFGDPRVLTTAMLPADGGAASMRALVKMMVGEQHAGLIDRLSSGTVFEIHQVYMGVQVIWGKAWYDFGASSVQGSDGVTDLPRVDALGRTKLPGTGLAESFARVFGPPASRFAEGIKTEGGTPSAPSGDGLRIVGLGDAGGGDHTQNGQVRP